MEPSPHSFIACSVQWSCRRALLTRMSLQEGLAEAEVFCRLMVQNKIDDLLDPRKRAEMPAGFNYRRLIVILAKYRCCHSQLPCPSRD